MAAAAETQQKILLPEQHVQLTPEQHFGFSLNTIAAMGRLSCEGAGVAYEQAREEAWADFVTGVQENVVISHQEHEDEASRAMRERLQFEPMRTLEIRDDKVVTARGESMVSLCEGGVEAARQKAALDERMQSEVERAENDVWVAREVDELAVGELLAVASMEPLEAMDRDGDEFWEKVSQIGYKRGLAVMQVYCRVSEHSVLAGAYSVKTSSKAAFRQLLAEHGTAAPADTTANNMIRHAVRAQATVEQAVAFGPGMRRRYQEIIGRQVDEVSVTKLIADNRPLVRAYFDVFIEALSIAAHTHKNNDTMRGYASTLLTHNADLLSPGDRHQLLLVANSPAFSTEDALFMEKTIRYACAEELWKILLEDKPDAEFTEIIASRSGDEQLSYHTGMLQARAASRVRTGLTVGRGGGGCSDLKFERPEGAVTTDTSDEELGQQGTFGGNADEEVGFDGRPLACDYIHDQCYCCPYDDFSNYTGVRKLVVAYRDREGTATCLRKGCGASIDKNGKVLSYGDIYELAQERIKQAELDAVA